MTNEAPNRVLFNSEETALYILSVKQRLQAYFSGLDDDDFERDEKADVGRLVESIRYETYPKFPKIQEDRIRYRLLREPADYHNPTLAQGILELVIPFDGDAEILTLYASGGTVSGFPSDRNAELSDRYLTLHVPYEFADQLPTQQFKDRVDSILKDLQSRLDFVIFKVNEGLEGFDATIRLMIVARDKVIDNEGRFARGFPYRKVE